MEIRIYTVGDYPYSFYAIGASTHNIHEHNMIRLFNDTFTEMRDNERFHGVWFEPGMNSETYSEYIVHGYNSNHEQDIVLQLACNFSELFACEVIIV